MSLELGQPTFVEVIRVDPLITEFCESNLILGKSAWQNPRDPYDVNGDGEVNSDDYATLVDWISQNSASQLPGIKPPNDPWVDVNGDGFLTDEDLQLLYHKLEGGVYQAPKSCHAVNSFTIERDLVAPSQLTGCVTTLVRSVACLKGIPTSNHTAYLVVCDRLVELGMDDTVSSKDAILFVHNDLLVPRNPYVSGCTDTPKILNRILARLSKQIMPARYDPRCPLPTKESTPDWKPGDPWVVPTIPDDPIEPDVPDIPGSSGTTTTTTSTTTEPTGLLQRALVMNIFSGSKRYLYPEPWYTISGGSHYSDDKAYWNRFIQSIAGNESINVKAGMLHAQIEDVYPPGAPLPNDSFGQMKYVGIPRKSNPTLSTTDIVQAFHILTNNGAYIPTALIIVEDIFQSQLWAESRDEAIAQLRQEFPRMEIFIYPFSKTFSRWMLMDLDAVFQLMRQNDNTNLSIDSKYRAGAPVGQIHDSNSFRELRLDHMEYRFLSNRVLGKCYAVMDPHWFRIFDWSTPSKISISFESSPFYVYQYWRGRSEPKVELVDLGPEDNGPPGRPHVFRWMLVDGTGELGPLTGQSSNQPVDFRPDTTANGLLENLIRGTLRVKQIGSEPIGSGLAPVPIWQADTLDWTAIQNSDARIKQWASYFPGRYGIPSGPTVRSARSTDVLPIIREDLEDNPEDYFRTQSSEDENVIHIGSTNIGNLTGADSSLAIWFEDTHAIVTVGATLGPPTKNHFVAYDYPGETSPLLVPSGSGKFDAVYPDYNGIGRSFFERKIATAVYSDPDFQDIIFNAVEEQVVANRQFQEFKTGFTPINVHPPVSFHCRPYPKRSLPLTVNSWGRSL